MALSVFVNFWAQDASMLKKSLCPSVRGDPEDFKTHPTVYFSKILKVDNNVYVLYDIITHC